MMSMQMVSVKTAQDAYHRTQATTLAYQMTDALRAKCAAPNVTADALTEYIGRTYATQPIGQPKTIVSANMMQIRYHLRSGD